jgi:hypothetical protein
LYDQGATGSDRLHRTPQNNKVSDGQVAAAAGALVSKSAMQQECTQRKLEAAASIKPDATQTAFGNAVGNDTNEPAGAARVCCGKHRDDR